jgi:hypothetical protein
MRLAAPYFRNFSASVPLLCRLIPVGCGGGGGFLRIIGYYSSKLWFYAKSQAKGTDLKEGTRRYACMEADTWDRACKEIVV